jgi:hypothetical protein
MNELDRILHNYNEKEDELEIRLGYFTSDNYFRSSISYDRYNCLIDFFTNSLLFTSSYEECDVHMYSNGVRIIKTDTEEIITKKIKKDKINIPQNGIRIALSREEKLSSPPSKKYMVKKRRRSSYLHKSKKYKVDMTFDTLPNSIQYQCEIEFILTPTQDEIKNIIKNILNIIKI